MADNVVYKSGAGITDIDSTYLEATGTKFACVGAGDAPEMTDYSDIKAGIVGNPGDIGGVTPATNIVTDDFQIGDSTPFADSSGVLTLQTVDAIDTTTRDTIYDALNAIADAKFYDEFWTAQGNEWATRVTTGSVSSLSQDNGWIRLTTGAANTNEEALDWGDVCTFANTKHPTFECRVKLEQVTVLEAYFGFIETSGGGVDDYILIGFDAYSQNTWFCEASTAGTPTTDMGAVADTNEVKLKIVFTSDTALEWFIDDVSQGTIATNVPTAQLQPVMIVRTQEAAAHFVDVDYVKIWQDRV